MTAEPNTPIASVEETSEPGVLRHPVPVWLIILLFVLLYWGMVYFDTQGGWEPVVYKPYHSVQELMLYQPMPGEGPDLRRGRDLYEQICVGCHNNDGAGKPGQAPPLAGSEWVDEPPNRMIAIPMVGLTGPIKVKGQDYNLSMPAFGNSLNDEDIANAISYIRVSWGNKASIVSPAQVKAVRDSLATHFQPLTADEVRKRPEK